MTQMMAKAEAAALSKQFGVSTLQVIMAEGAIKAFWLIVAQKQLKVNALVAKKVLTDTIQDEWADFIKHLSDAQSAHMGNAMYREIMNTWCNGFAVDALKHMELL
jgi:capsid protein